MLNRFLKTVKANFSQRDSGFKTDLTNGNYLVNKEFNIPEGPINGQGRPVYRDLLYGIVDIGWSGCGLVALYNAMYLLGKPVSLSGIIHWADSSGASILFGVFGTSMNKIKEYLSKNSFETKEVKDDFDRYIREYGIAILEYWNDKSDILKGKHIVCIEYQKKNNRVMVYNLYNNSIAPTQINSISDLGNINPVKMICAR